MTKEVIGEQGFYKLDHPYYREVYETTYIEDVITDIQLGDDPANNLLNLPNTCTLEESGVLPVFYNCKKGCYSKDTGKRVGEDMGISKIPEEEALFDGVKAFNLGQKVKVLCEKKEPKYIIGHADHEPRMCADIFKVRTVGWNKIVYYTYYSGSTAKEYCPMSVADGCSDPYGVLLSTKCTEKGYKLYGQGEFQKGTIQNYLGDFFIKVGPIMYIMRVASTGFPGIMTGSMFLFGALWTEDLEAECKRIGAIAEEEIGDWLEPMPSPAFPVYPPEIKFQKIFTQTFNDRFRGWWVDHAPRWVFTEVWGERQI